MVWPDATAGGAASTGAAPATALPVLEPPALGHLRSLRGLAVEAVVGRITIARSDDRCAIDRPPWDRRREDLFTLLDFLDPSVEFGLLQPLADFLDWSASRTAPCATRRDQLVTDLQALAAYFEQALDAPHGFQVADLLGAVLAVFAKPPQSHVQVRPPLPQWPESVEFGAALIGGHQADALQLMERCLAAGRGYTEFGRNVVQAAMQEVGRRWQEGGLTVAVEHHASCIARAVMVAALARSEARPRNDRTVLLACVEGNEHDMGLHLVAGAFQLHGWGVHCLGANVPTHDLVDHVRRLAPDVLCLGVSLSHQLRLVRNIALSLRSRPGERLPVLLAGGLAAVRYERLVRDLGADAVAVDADDAVELATRLCH